jgi:hypothetical protein
MNRKTSRSERVAHAWPEYVPEVRQILQSVCHSFRPRPLGVCSVTFDAHGQCLSLECSGDAGAFTVSI